MLHIDIPGHDDIQCLSSFRAPECMSIYLPTSPVTTDADADRIQFKNLAREGVERLTAAGASRASIEAMEEEIDDLLTDRPFWAYQANSLALFLTPDRLLTFRLPNQLEPVVETGDRFFIKPLLRSVTVPQSAFVLALSQGEARLVEVANEQLSYPVEVPDMPVDLDSAVVAPTMTDKMPRGGDSTRQHSKTQMRQYSLKVDRAVRGLLQGSGMPLILAATRPIDSIFRSVNSYPYLLEQSFRGNAEQVSDNELRAETRALLDELWAGTLAELRDTFAVREERGLATTDIAYAARAATFGAVSKLMVDIDAVVPGTIDEETGLVTYAEEGAAGAYGVIDEIARRTLAAGGDVLAVRADDMPEGAQVAAILRFAV